MTTFTTGVNTSNPVVPVGWMTIADCAVRLGVSHTAVQHLVNTGKVRTAVDTLFRTLVRNDEVERLLAANAEQRLGGNLCPRCYAPIGDDAMAHVCMTRSIP
jgi:hypothetical protein